MILIYLDSKDFFGGVQILTHRFASYLRQRKIPYIIAENENTRFSTMNPEHKFIIPSNIKEISAKISCVFFPSFPKIRMAERYLNYLSHCNILGWIVHPNDPFRSFYPFSSKLINVLGYPGVRPMQMLFRQHTRLVRDLFNSAILSGGVVSMDGATNRSLKYFFQELSKMPDIIPIPSPSLSYVNRITTKGSIANIGYLGRLDEFKMSALRPFLLEYAAVEKFRFHLVGEGAGLAEIKSICQKNNIDLLNYGFRPNDEAREILRTNTNFVVAMGTAALDVAGTNIPCVIIDPAIKKSTSRQKKFCFVHEIEDYTLGEYRDFPLYQPGMHSIGQLSRMVRDDPQIGQKGRDYVAHAHNPEQIFDSLLDKLHASKFKGSKAGELVNAINKSFRKIKFYSGSQ